MCARLIRKVGHWLRQRSGKVIMKILLQSKTTGDYVGCGGGWTWKLGRARVFPTGLEAIMFCFDHQIRSIQIVGAFRNMTENFSVPVTDYRGD